MSQSIIITSKDRVLSFLRQHILLLISLDIMTLGVALCVKSNLGSSVISSIPYVLTLAGGDGKVPALTIGTYTILMNFFFVILQILILRRRFVPTQLFQLVIGFLFGWFIDLNMVLLSPLLCDTLLSQIICQLVGCTVLGIGIAFEVRCGSVTMPGEGITLATSQVTGRPFAKVKMVIDTLLVAAAVSGSFLYFGRWRWEIIGIGTLFAMLYVGLVVKTIAPHLGWFDRIISGHTSLRFLYGLRRNKK